MWVKTIQIYGHIYRYLACVGLAVLALFQAGIAYAADVRIQASLDQSGGIVGPLNVVGDDFCPSSTTPGCDMSATDTRVRTHDAVSYNVSVQVDPPGDNVYVKVQFKPGLTSGDLPGACDQFNSAITGDGTAGSPTEIYCDLGFRSSFATTLTFFGIVDGRLANGSTVGLQSAEVGGDASPTTQANVSGLADQVVTAVPRLNVQNRMHTYSSNTRAGERGVDFTYRYYVGLWNNDRNGDPSDNPDPRLGHEDVTSPVTWIEDMSDISPNAYIINCSLSGTRAFPYSTFNSSFPERSFTDAGAVSCGPYQATGSVTVTLTGADLSTIHVPTQNRAGQALTGTYKYAAAGFVRVFIPFTDIEDAGGTLVVTNRYTNFAATSISGQTNFNGQGEDETDNVASRTLSSRGGSFSHTFRCHMFNETAPPWCGDYWADAPTNASVVWAGDGVIEPEQTFATYTYYRNLSFVGDEEAAVCTVIDSRYLEVTPSPGVSSPTLCHGQCGKINTDYIIEYGNNYIATAWRDAAVTPSDAVRNECNATAAQAGWTTDYNAAKSAGPITKVRLTRLTELQDSKVNAVSVRLAAKTPAGLTGVPSGTLLRTWGTGKATTSFDGEYRGCAYTSGSYPSPSHRQGGCGDRLALTRALATIEKTTQPSNAVNAVEAGADVTFRLAPTFTSIGGSITDNVKVIDELPAGTNYVSGSATQNGNPFPPVVTGSSGSGQTLTWDLGTIQVNDPIAPIEFKMSVPSFTPGGTQLVNKVRVETDSDISNVASRSDTRGVNVTAPKSMLMDKTVNTASIDRDGRMTFTVTYDNATNESFSEVDVIDPFPATGDGRFPASNYSGQTNLGVITTASNNAAFYVTKDSVSQIDSDPQASRNNLSSGAAKWCPMTNANTVNPSATPSSGGGASQCPSSAQQVTGLRLIDTQSLPAGTNRSFTFELLTSGNVGDDIYTNQAQGTADTISLSPLSPYATVTVAGTGLLSGAKAVTVWDPDNAGLYATPGQDVIYTFTVVNTGDGPIDSNSMVLIDTLPPEIEFWNGDIEAGGPDDFAGSEPVGFEQTVGSGVTFTSATDLRFKTGASAPTSFAQCTAIAQDDTYRPDIQHVCFNPKGELDNGTPNPTITLSIRARIK